MSQIPKDFYRLFGSKYMDYYQQFLTAIYEESGRSFSLLGLTEGEEAAAADIADGYKQARAYHDKVLPKMEALREAVDTAEVLTGEDYWPVPSYTDLLFRV